MHIWISLTVDIPWMYFKTLRSRPNGRHFPQDIFKCIFLNKNVSIAIEISLKSIPNGPIDNIPALVQILALHRPGNKPLSEPMMVWLPTHICVTHLQWVKRYEYFVYESNISTGSWWLTGYLWKHYLFLKTNICIAWVLVSKSMILNVARIYLWSRPN